MRVLDGVGEVDEALERRVVMVTICGVPSSRGPRLSTIASDGRRVALVRPVWTAGAAVLAVVYCTASCPESGDIVADVSPKCAVDGILK
jgi:hypothetical protein